MTTATNRKTDRGRVQCGTFKTMLGYARYCQRGLCHDCNYRGCECPHHSGGKPDPEIIRNCREFDVGTKGWWVSGCCQLAQHENCPSSTTRCGCRCHVR